VSQRKMGTKRQERGGVMKRGLGLGNEMTVKMMVVVMMKGEVKGPKG